MIDRHPRDMSDLTACDLCGKLTAMPVLCGALACCLRCSKILEAEEAMSEQDSIEDDYA